MNDQAKHTLQNVMVFALADGKLTEEEKQYIDRLRRKLEIDAAEFRDLCEQVRRDPKKVWVPKDTDEAETTIRLLAETAAVDGEVSGTEVRLLRRLAQRVGVEAARVDLMLAEIEGVAQVDEAELARRCDEIYACFVGWDEPTRRGKLQELAAMGRTAAVYLLRILESYRRPDGANDAIQLKTLAAEQLGQVADERAAYYLAQQVNIGDVDDELSSATLRYASVEALGKIVGQPFTPDQDGVNAARQWWLSVGIREYDQLAF